MIFSRNRIPTTDLYFANACMSWASKSPQFRCEGKNSFSNEKSIIICRKEKNHIFRRLIKQKNKLFYYIIDDNLWDIEESNDLPLNYKNKLIKLRDGQHSEIIKMSEAVIVPSNILRDKYRERGYRSFRMNPFWSENIPDVWNFEKLNNHSPLRIGFLGTASHVDDRKFVIQVYQGLLESCANVELTIFGVDGIHKKFLNSKKIKIQKYKNWESYRNIIRNLNFDILLYPILQSKFNDARSLNKIVEHAVCGGLGVYSESWEHADIINSTRIGLTWKNNVDYWVENLTLLSVTRNFQEYAGNISNVKILNEKSRLDQIEYWSNAILN